ncbi:hypothetical protein H5T87_09615 [bacterium]|nr:hypothetical protein [bacterium]
MKKIFLLLFSISSFLYAIPPGALVVDISDVRNTNEINVAIRNALFKESKRFQDIMRVWAILRGTSPFRNRLPPSFDRIVYLRQNGRIILPTSFRGDLTFQFQGWSDEEKTKLQSFVQKAYPLIKELYGAPAWGGTVTVLKDTSLNDFQVILAGVYDVSTATIHMEWGRSGDIETYYRLLHLMLHAFHGPYQIDFDAWEEGIAWAATRVLFSQLFPAESFSYYCTFYLFPWYELLNQPSLSAPTFWSKTLTDCSGYMSIWRHSQALSAWLKVYIENRDFFSQFNNLYYQEVKADPSISSNLAKLQGICSQIVPMIEGLSFDEWYAQQYVLQPKANYGPNLFVWNSPQLPKDPESDGYSLSIILFYYYSTGEEETPLNAVVTPRYWNYDFSIDLPVEDQYAKVDIKDGIGSVAPTFFNIGGPQRVTIEFPVGGQVVSIIFPYGVVGTTAEPNNIYGALVSGLGGSLLINGIEVPITQGAFGAPFPSLNAGPQQIDVIYISPTGERLERKINCYYGPYAVLIQPPREKQVVSKSFKKGIYMISPPLSPLSHDPAVALGVPPDKLALAHWEPTKSGNNKYLYYPQASFVLGSGYFIRFLEDKEVQLEGYTEPLDGAFSIGLSVGWNQIGYPYPQGGCALADILVRIPEATEPISFVEANKKGYIGPTFWRFDPDTQSYVALDASKDTLQPWEGYWIRCYKECTLIIPGPNSYKLIKGNDFRRFVNSHSGWKASIEISNSGKVYKLIFGQGENPLSESLEFPPPLSDQPKVYFFDPKQGGSFAWDIKSLGPSSEWIIHLQVEGECVISWRDLTTIPKGYSLTLTDIQTGKKISLLHSSSYRFVGDGSIRLLSLQLMKKNPLLISNLIAKPTRGGVEFAFVLSREAYAEIKVQSLDGKILKTIRTTREEGTNSVCWDGRDERGTLLPAGIYIFRVIAYSEGEVVQAIRTFILR